jgi:hypothetical protein
MQKKPSFWGKTFTGMMGYYHFRCKDSFTIIEA